VALSENNQVIASRIDTNGQNHSKLIGTFVQEVLQEAGFTAHQLDAVALSAGPGSYTGLRIGTSFVKGLCFGANIKVITLPTLQVLAQEALLQNTNIESNAHLCPMIDARRMEVYTAMYDAKLNQISPAEAKIIDENSFAEIDCPIYFCGSGAEKCSKVIQNSNANFDTTINPTANMMVDLAEEAYDNKQFEDVAYYEPFYLKEFYTPQKTQKTEN
jgi:tRNA threonylcarbamoyladenosine biosynthesis protein TsaB